MGVFDVEPREFPDRVSFNHYLAENYDTLVDGDLYVIAGLTQYSRDEFLELLRREGYEIVEDYGGIQKISCDFGGDRPAEFYFTYDVEESVILFYTDMRKTEEIKNTVEPLLENQPGVHYLYISPGLLQEIREKIVSDDPATEITEFVAKRTERTDTSSRFRPDEWRTINYYGRDGLESLREMEESYGVLPRIMEFNVPGDLRFRINHEGVFKLKSGSLLRLFKHIEMCIEEALKVKLAYERTDFRMVRASKSLEVPTAEPATVALQNSIQYHELDALKQSLSEENYVLFNTYAEEGSLYFTTEVIDRVKNSAFRIKANENQIRIFPQDESDLGTFYRFYEFIQDSVDERAELARV
ncbi:hypothetical protein C453_01460 [Haloferax elongans ATCC BAA-1513]|uniref:Uncharacterized protein n=1 Tax=Haloferax elongans ATCC BAA-1513 TaxID=1230453 RepID=M0HV64_HALEO|nr:hypothetical protein [Haloferax elongans]ELZ88490.1 hypothetical protein C453_01460 [Haloferax elongans ATCC BAA-1513]